MRTALLLTIVAALAPNLLAARKWTPQFFYDDAREVLHFADIAFPSANRGVAVGTIVDEAKRRIKRHVAMVTSDGGTNWAEVELKELPRSLFFLDDTEGWLVTDRAIWKTIESGRSWTRVSRRKDVHQVWFLDSQHGFAVGENLEIAETVDGGEHWKTTKPDFGFKSGSEGRLTQIQFVTPRVGLITGEAVTDRSGRRFRTHKLVELATSDGGKTWAPSSSDVAGVIEDLALKGTRGLALVRLSRRSDLLRIDLPTGESSLAYQTTDKRITTTALFEEGAYAAGTSQNNLMSPYLTLPTKVRVLESTDLEGWREIAVDYRAEATRVILAGTGPDNLFLATDQGMILKLE